jgi:hypothetical protein
MLSFKYKLPCILAAISLVHASSVIKGIGPESMRDEVLNQKKAYLTLILQNTTYTIPHLMVLGLV